MPWARIIDETYRIRPRPLQPRGEFNHRLQHTLARAVEHGLHDVEANAAQCAAHEAHVVMRIGKPADTRRIGFIADQQRYPLRPGQGRLNLAGEHEEQGDEHRARSQHVVNPG
ncbi:MAG: hypothetical protein R3D27_02415 [Hyphomicrobiaceae bacterium]